MKLLADIKKEEGLSVLLITHDLALVSQNTDDVAVMYSGRIVETAPNEEFFSNPKHPYTKALLNSLPSNSNNELKVISGQPPLLSEIISGCRFNPRCDYVTENCKTCIPELRCINDSHKSACHLNSI